LFEVYDLRDGVSKVRRSDSVVWTARSECLAQEIDGGRSIRCAQSNGGLEKPLPGLANGDETVCETSVVLVDVELSPLWIVEEGVVGVERVDGRAEAEQRTNPVPQFLQGLCELV
jgi:hypothetical protein